MIHVFHSGVTIPRTSLLEIITALYISVCQQRAPSCACASDCNTTQRTYNVIALKFARDLTARREAISTPRAYSYAAALQRGFYSGP
jgi:hypothetical protein